MNQFLDIANQLADAAGEIIRGYYRQPIPIDHKSDASPVTKADREAEQAMRRFIKARFPEHGVIGEEYGNENENAEYVWVLDPIDGTASFIAGRPIFVTLIALLHRGRPVLGVIDQPITGERWSGAAGMPATLNGKDINVRNCVEIQDAVVATTSPELFSSEGSAFFQSICKKARRTVYGGDGYNYALFASGHLDLIVEEGLKAHDVMALIPVIEGAGGVITDWQGAPIALSDKPVNVLAASPSLHSRLL